jgi:mannosidase alpha-like ER degradation enhancer 1
LYSRKRSRWVMQPFSVTQLIRQYLYLLFDDTPPSSLSNAVFTTEGHSLSLPHSLLAQPSPIRRELHRGEQQFCPAYRPPHLNGLRGGIEQRDDWEYCRTLIYGDDLNGEVGKEERKFWSPDGYCAIPNVPKFVSTSLLARNESDDSRSM